MEKRVDSMQRVLHDFIEAQSFLRSYGLAPTSPLPSTPPVNKLDQRHTGRLRKRDHLLPGGVCIRGWARRQIIRPQESLGLFESFNTLWEHVYTVHMYWRIRPEMRELPVCTAHETWACLQAVSCHTQAVSPVQSRAGHRTLKTNPDKL